MKLHGARAAVDSMKLEHRSRERWNLWCAGGVGGSLLPCFRSLEAWLGGAPPRAGQQHT